LEFLTNINNSVVTVKLLKKRGMKNTYLRVKSPKLIQINSNSYFTKDDAVSLIEKKQKWLEKNIENILRNALKNDEFYFLGVKHQNLDNRDLDKFYKEESKKIIPPLVAKYSQIMKLYPTNIKFRKNKRTWGSCNYKNGLNFNTLLVKFPLEAIEYVVIHELAHIKQKNHSNKFWLIVETFCPDYKNRIKLFKSFL